MYKPDKTHPASSSFSAVEMKITQMAQLKRSRHQKNLESVFTQ